MTEEVYANITSGETEERDRGERQMEMEERGERIDDIYVTPDDQDPYVTADDFDSRTQQYAAQNNTAQQQLQGKILKRK